MISMDTKAAFVHFSLFVEQIARRLTPAEQKQRIRSFFPFFMDISPGRPVNSYETEVEFLKKEQTQKILKSLKRGLTIREVCKVVDCSNKTVIKTKKLGQKHNLLPNYR